MTPQFPFKCRYQITQTYSQNLNNYPEGHHGAIDIVPLDDNGHVFPAPIYPIFPGSEIAIQDTDVVKGKGVRERLLMDGGLYQYLKANGCIDHEEPDGQYFLDVLYWHMLDVTDKDGTLSDDTPIGHAGNTGMVYHNGIPVPDNQKGVPPYLGLHTHLETSVYLKAKNYVGYINLGKDPQGRIDPMLVLAYKGISMLVPKRVVKQDMVTYGVMIDTPNGCQIIYATGEDQWRSWNKQDSYQLPTVNAAGATVWEHDYVLPF